jgi:ribosomal protein L21
VGVLNVNLKVVLKFIIKINSGIINLCRQLAKISRSTRGVVLLLCDLNAARRVMSEAQRLKMTGGHFIWIWADTSSTAEFFQPNSVLIIDEKDQLMNIKSNYQHQHVNERKIKYEKSETSPTDRQYYQQTGNKRPQQNNTRQKTSNTNSNRFHHIIGLRKPEDELNGDDGGFPAILPERSFFKSDKLRDMSTGQVPVKDKKARQAYDVENEGTTMDSHSIESDYESSIENGKTSKILNIKNINSHEFNANYYDPYSPNRQGEHDDNMENVFGGDFDESTNEENEYLEYDKINPYHPNPGAATSATFTTTTRRSMSDTSELKSSEKLKANNRNNANNSNRNNRNNGNNNKAPNPLDKITTIPYSKFFDENDNLDLESYSEASESDLKAKRADNFPSAFNISSHVFFHHFKDFPVGLLALRHIKMNVDRVFVRSAVRLFATTWSRVEKDEELRMATGGKVGGRGKSNWQDNWSGNDYDYDEVNTNPKTNSRKQKNKTNVNVNSRHNNARGSRKYKRDTQEVEKDGDDETATVSNLVNSSNKATINSKSKLIRNLSNRNYSQHVSGLDSHASDADRNKSNNDNIKINNIISNSNKSKAAVNQEAVHELNVKGNIEVQKRQNSWWSNTFRGRNQEKVKTARGTPQYKGGCFGVPTRSDMKRSELFAR